MNSLRYAGWLVSAFKPLKEFFYKNNTVKLIILGLIFILSGCASQPQQATTPPLQALNDLKHWQIEGKLGYRDNDNRAANGSAWLNWQQQNAQYNLRLNGPFGSGATRIEGDQNGATLHQAGRPSLRAASGEELSESLFGWPFPVTQMRYWVKGIPAPSDLPTSLVTPPSSITTNDNGIRQFSQAGWQLSFSHFKYQQGWLLPSKIKGQQGTKSFTLVVKKWHIAAPAPTLEDSQQP